MIARVRPRGSEPPRAGNGGPPAGSGILKGLGVGGPTEEPSLQGVLGGPGARGWIAWLAPATPTSPGRSRGAVGFPGIAAAVVASCRNPGARWAKGPLPEGPVCRIIQGMNPEHAAPVMNTHVHAGLAGEKDAPR